MIALADRFVERSTRGIFTRMVGSWLLVSLPVVAARIWWSAAGAIAIFVLTLTMYLSAIRYMRRRRQQP